MANRLCLANQLCPRRRFFECAVASDLLRNLTG